MEGGTAKGEGKPLAQKEALSLGEKEIRTKALTQKSCNVGLAGGRREELSGGALAAPQTLPHRSTLACPHPPPHPRQQELLFHFLQLVAGVEHHQQKFRSQASVLDEIVDTAFEVRQAGPEEERGPSGRTPEGQP